MKIIEIPRVFVNEKYELEMIFKKIYITEKDGEKYLKFPVELYDDETEEELHGEIYEIRASDIKIALNNVFTELNEKAKNEEINNYSISKTQNDITVQITMDEQKIYYLIVRCDELGEEGEDIIAIDYYKEGKCFDQDSFGLDLMLEVAKEELELFVDSILKNEI